MRKAALLFIFFAFTTLVVSAYKSYYDILEVSQDAKEEEIKKQFRKLSLKYHPDKNPGNEEAAQKFVEIKKAYEILSDPEKRQIYDLQGEEGLEKPQQQNWDPFAAFFGGGQQQQQRGPSMRADHEVTLEELYLGATKQVKLSKNVICPKCRGTGAKDAQVKKCHSCGGQGTKLTLQQLGPGFTVQMQTTCDVCGGRGTVSASKCPHCSGKKVVRDEKTLSLIIEKGMPDGHEIVFEKEGEQQPGIMPGDVIIKLNTKPHPTFRRRGDDLLHDMTISLKEALIGFKKKITHLDGHIVKVKSDQVISHGQKMILTGEGMPHHNFPSQKGNLEITFSIRMPTSLTAEQKQAVRKLLEEPAASTTSQ